jgi:trigger factor
MPTIDRHDVDNVNAVITVKAEPADYSEKVKKELNKLRKGAQMKGFRKGKTPMSIIRKMYGKQVVFEVVNEIIGTELQEYLDTIEREALGQPIPMSDEEVNYDFRVGNKDGYTFKFKVGFKPEFELKGYDKEMSMTTYNVTIDDAKIDEEVENLRKRAGENISVEDNIQEADVLEIYLEELEGEEVKENGVTNDSTLAVDLINEELRAHVLTLKKGDSFTANINTLDTKMEKEEDVRRYLLGIEDAVTVYGEQFKVTINNIKRQELAEVNEEFFQKAFPNEDITDEAGMREFLANDYVKYYQDQVDKLLLAQYQRDLMDMHDLELPEAFLKEWLIATNEKINEGNVEAEYKAMEKGLRWSFLQTAIADKEGIKVTEEEIEEAIQAEVSQYFGGQVDPSMMNNLMDRFMNDRQYVNQYVERILNERITKAVKEAITLDVQDVSGDEFNEIIKKYNEEFNQAEKSLDEALTETVEDLVEVAEENAEAPVVEENTEE